jgi:L-asparaginase
VFPGITASFIHAFLHSSNLKGVVLETFGAGNAPEREGKLPLIVYLACRLGQRD